MADRRDTQHRLNALAHRQAGYVTARQALDVGYSHQSQKYHVDHGNWARVERGIFRLRGWPSTIEDSYVLWSLWSGGRGVLSHSSALAVHDIGVLDPGFTHLIVPRGFRARHPAVVTTVAALSREDVEDHGPYRVTTALRTLLDLAADRATEQEAVDDAVLEALERGAVTPHDLRARSDALGDHAALRVERALGAVAS